jgi:hypothetical protein
MRRRAATNIQAATIAVQTPQAINARIRSSGVKSRTNGPAMAATKANNAMTVSKARVEYRTSVDSGGALV